MYVPRADVLLEDVVLDGAADALPGDVLLFGQHEIEREEDRRRGVDRHGGRDAIERDAFEQAPHVGDRVDRHSHPSDLAARHRVIAVVADLGRKIEGDREPAGALGEEIAIAPVRLRRVREAGVLAHRPETALVHLAVDAAGEGKAAGFADRRPRVDRGDVRRGIDGGEGGFGAERAARGCGFSGAHLGVGHGPDCSAAEGRIWACRSLSGGELGDNG